MKKELVAGAYATGKVSGSTSKKPNSAKERLRKYFKDNPNKAIDIDTLEKIACDGNKLRDWTRQLRSLRDEDMNIVYIRPCKAEEREAAYKYIPE